MIDEIQIAEPEVEAAQPALDAIETYCAKLQEEIECTRALAPVLKTAELICLRLNLHERAHGQSPLAIIKWSDLPFVAICIYCDSFNESVPILRELAKEGYHTDKKEPWTDYAEIKRRTFNLLNGTEVKAYWGTIYRLRLQMFIRDGEGAKCRVVQVGSEPKYELVCDDSEGAK